LKVTSIIKQNYFLKWTSIMKRIRYEINLVKLLSYSLFLFPNFDYGAITTLFFGP